MYAVGRLGSYITRGVYTVSGPFHPFGGAVDIIVVEQPDGTFKSSPWYVRFGKFQGVLKAREKIVTINVNGGEANFHMYLDQRGEAYFLREVEDEDNESGLYPSSSGDETEGLSLGRRPLKSKSCNYDANGSISDDPSSSGKVVARTNSRRRIFGLWGRRKSDGFQVDVSGPGVGRVDSLERAEIAADLLEMKWSTNISTKNYRKERASRLSSSNDPVSKSDRDLQVHDGKGVTDFLEHDNYKGGLSKDVLPDEMVEAVLSVENIVCPVEEYSKELVNSGSLEPQVEISAVSAGVNNAKQESKVVKISRIDENVTIQKHRLLQGMVDSHDLCVENLRNSNTDVISEVTELVSEASVSSAIGHNPRKLDELIVNEKNVDLPECNIFEETGPDGFKSLSCYGASEELDLTMDESMEQTCKAVLPDSNGTMEACVKDICAGPPRENEQDAQQVMLFRSSINDLNDLSLKEPVSSMSSFDQTVHFEAGCDMAKEAKAHGVCSTSATSARADKKNKIGDSTMCKLQCPKSINVTQDPFGDCFIPNTKSTTPSESSSEEQFLFSDLDEDKLNGDGCVDMSMAVSHNEERDLSLGLKYDGVTGLGDMKDKLDISSENSSPDNSSSDVEESREMRSIISGPINIAQSQNTTNDEISRLVESMPIMRSMVNSLESDELHIPLIQTVDLDSKCLEVPKTSNKDVECSSSQVCEQSQLMEGQLNANENQVLASAKTNPHGSLVELSLCRHLLYEGMGADAASKAFDAEKLDTEKFTTLGPAVVKDDKLVVRIGHRYFPWDAAGPIVLGMVSFGSEQIFVPKGMIAVEQVERSPVGDSSKAIVASNGNWKIWPFSFKRSGSRKIIPKSKSFDAGNLLENGDIMNTDAAILKPKTVKRMVRVTTPTSEQLASLNLKEGSNSVTFTFSTAMLGKQEVDARIYLWKWNTRIIISDVDGTITKSDVLGQVMPLVGMDWSHIGVAHLYSAIKENGYQMLFLSARAISQAYHTRQFLFNLKQEGKTLPDGPVVISPDGLFPSLYREVIRRAPHEFKIACLEEIKALFPPDHNPFYAGFGNRDTDEISYLKVGIPKGKIFIINPKGEVAVNRHVNTKSYKSIHTLVHGMFPPTVTSEQEDYNAWNYWKLPPPEIDI